MRVPLYIYVLSNIVVLPVVVGIIKYKKLDSIYRCFLYHLGLAFFWEVSSPILPRNIEYVNLENYLFTGSIVPFSYFSLMSWAMMKNVNKKTIMLTIIIIMLACIELSIYGLEKIRVTYSAPLLDIISVILGLNAFFVIYSKKYSVMERRSLFMLVIPLIVINSFSTILYITLALYYSPSNQEFFIKLFNVSHVLNALAFICYSLSFILKPPKQVYL